MTGAAWAAGFVALYVLLDWASYILPMKHLNLTPWNPAPALGLLFMIRRGPAAVVALFAAIVASNLFVHNLPGGFSVSLGLGGILTAGYAAIAWQIRRRFPDGGMFSDRRGLLLWSVIVIAGSVFNGLLFVSTLLAASLLPAGDWGSALMRFWVGDGVGIFVTMPLLWWLQDAPRRRLFLAVTLRWETAGYLALALLALWIAFVPGAAAHFRYFYVLFLPLVWAASRQGVAGAVLCVAMLQIGMLLAGLQYDPQDISLFELQMRAALLALVGFLIGVSVDEQRRAAADLRHSLRLAAAGEMAGALAHELNQPLTALSAYGSACERLMATGAGEDRLREAIRKMLAEASRAAEVVRRLRDFFRTGATRLERIPLPVLVATVVAPFAEKAASAGIVFSVETMPEVEVNVDRLQIEVVLRNLLANAFESVSEASTGKGCVRVAASEEPGGRILVEISDSGPGLPPALADQAFEPFRSTKSSGLGLGLAISRAIAEAHGGSLVADAGGQGCFRLILPVEQERKTYG